MMRVSGAVIVVITMIGVAGVSAQSQSADDKAIMQHRLTLDLIQRTVAVDRDMIAALKKDPGLLKRGPERTSGIEASVAEMNKLPEIARILEANKITARDYLLTELAMFSTVFTNELMASGKMPPLPKDTPVHNLDFWKKNAEALKPIEAEWRALREQLMKHTS